MSEQKTDPGPQRSPASVAGEQAPPSRAEQHRCPTCGHLDPLIAVDCCDEQGSQPEQQGEREAMAALAKRATTSRLPIRGELAKPPQGEPQPRESIESVVKRSTAILDRANFKDVSSDLKNVIADLTRQLAEVAKSLPSPWYNDRPIATRVKFLAEQWHDLDDANIYLTRKCVEARQEVERMTKELSQQKKYNDADVAVDDERRKEIADLKQEVERLKAENESAREDWERRCGCRKCICEDEEQCQGCGSHECSYHNRQRRELQTQLTAAQAAQKAAEERAEKAEAACVAYRHWLITESGWENFREEYSLCDTARAKNAKTLRDWLAANNVESVGRNWLEGLRKSESAREAAEKELATCREELAQLRSQVVRGPETLGEGRYEVYRKVSGVRSGEGPYVLSADAIALRRPDEKGDVC